jgi:hypothetical protein
MDNNVDNANSCSENSCADAVGIFLVIMVVVGLAVTWVSGL